MFSEKDDNISDFANVSAITAACAVLTWQDQSPVAQVFQEMINAGLVLSLDTGQH